jgi:sugar-specific transcriptional regulator TrmB
MIETNSIIQPLSELGLSRYESNVYLTLVSEGVSTAKSISDITGIPYGKVYEIINSLSHKGFVMLLPTKPMKCGAVSPKQAIITAKKEHFERFEKTEANLLESLEPGFEQNKNFSNSKSSFGVINGRSNIVRKTEEMIKNAKSNINIQCSANSLSRLILHKDALKDASDRGVKISIAGIIDKKNLEEIRSLNFCSIGQVKSSKNNLLSADGKESLIIEPIPDDDNILYGRDLGIYAVSSSFTKFLDNFFEHSFKKAKPIDL